MALNIKNSSQQSVNSGQILRKGLLFLLAIEVVFLSIAGFSLGFSPEVAIRIENKFRFFSFQDMQLLGLVGMLSCLFSAWFSTSFTSLKSIPKGLILIDFINGYLSFSMIITIAARLVSLAAYVLRDLHTFVDTLLIFMILLCSGLSIIGMAKVQRQSIQRAIYHVFGFIRSKFYGLYHHEK